MRHRKEKQTNGLCHVGGEIYRDDLKIRKGFASTGNLSNGTWASEKDCYISRDTEQKLYVSRELKGLRLSAFS